MDSLTIISSILPASLSVGTETIEGRKPITLLKSRCNVSTANFIGGNSPSETTIRKLPSLKTREFMQANIHTDRMINNSKKIKRLFFIIQYT